MARVLVVDDDPHIRELVGHFLRMEGLEVVEAVDGLDAMRIFDQIKVDLLVLDIMMPGINGIEVLKIIKQKWPDLKVIIHSGVASKEEQDQTLTLGATAFLSKPYKVEKLLEVLDQ